MDISARAISLGDKPQASHLHFRIFLTHARLGYLPNATYPQVADFLASLQLDAT
jgi:hypothetical protein